MKLRAVHVREHPRLGDLSVEFRSTDGKVDEACWLVGGCGSGKTMLTDMVAWAWGCALKNHGFSHLIKECRVRVDFEVGGEIAVCDSGEYGRFGASPLLGGKIDLKGMKNLVLKYGRERLNQGAIRSDDGCTGVEAVYPLLDDISKGVVTDSVILVDDFDLGLDITDQKLFWSYLWKHHRSMGNQLIATGRRSMGFAREIMLPMRENPIELALERIKRGKIPA